MVTTVGRKRLFGVPAIAMAVPLCFATALATAKMDRSDAPLQQFAEAAALAGVTSLAATQGQPDDNRIAASVAAAQQVITASPSAIRSISPSSSRLSLSVVLADPQSGAIAQATVRYVAPSQGLAAQESASAHSIAAPSRAPM